jgi:hypothetical protein
MQRDPGWSPRDSLRMFLPMVGGVAHATTFRSCHEDHLVEPSVSQQTRSAISSSRHPGGNGRASRSRRHGRCGSWRAVGRDGSMGRAPSEKRPGGHAGRCQSCGREKVPACQQRSPRAETWLRCGCGHSLFRLSASDRLLCSGGSSGSGCEEATASSAYVLAQASILEIACAGNCL